VKKGKCKIKAFSSEKNVNNKG